MVGLLLDIEVALIGIVTGVLIGLECVLNLQFVELDAGRIAGSSVHAVALSCILVAVLTMLEAMNVIEDGGVFWQGYPSLWAYHMSFSSLITIIITLIVVMVFGV